MPQTTQEAAAKVCEKKPTNLEPKLVIRQQYIDTCITTIESGKWDDAKNNPNVMRAEAGSKNQ